MDKRYKDLSYFHLHLDSLKNKNNKDLIDNFHKEKNIIGASFFLGIRSLLGGSKNIFQIELYDDYDHNILYPLTLVEKWYAASSANTFWYYLENKWHDYKTAFNFSAISKSDQEMVVSLAKKINPDKYDGSVFNKELLVSIGNDFETSIFPRLFTLTYYNEQGIPETLVLLIRILLATMMFGVFVPLWLSSLMIENINIKIIISSISIIVLSLSIIYFIFSFKEILENEIKISQESI